MLRRDRTLAAIAQLAAAEEREDAVAVQAAREELAARGVQVALVEVETDVDAEEERN